MTKTLSRADELRADIENMDFTARRIIKELAELEQLGQTHTSEFKLLEENLRVLKSNIVRLEGELEKAEEDELEDPYYFSMDMYW